MKYFKL